MFAAKYIPFGHVMLAIAVPVGSTEAIPSFRNVSAENTVSARK